ncbi:thymidylate synthase, flavin-dependent [Pyramidobacter piscolens W5455]|uniref:Flavin-dependent thymidylate synthase n=1 Tax=Pyramidobacter piscolens W5455 TaxID=352165 RepID=A0ABP2HQV4_9BACT|nr:FAD-dependent thymidylate synthase [Pyramidobacter piscolens]EFB89748.1 thymidylate synthase, flavin-dependent [Pyramidobacter piscolens W5455]
MFVVPVDSSNLSVPRLARIARVCTTPLECQPASGAEEDDARLVRTLYENGHWSVFEHATMTFYIDGISRACSLQLARHRHISRTEMSQRYVTFTRVKDETDRMFLNRVCVLPEAYDSPKEQALCERALLRPLEAYREALEKYGMKPEDARMLLPEAAKTRMYVTFNLRTLLELMEKRGTNRYAQKEIRDLVNAMWAQVPLDVWQILDPLVREGSKKNDQ